MLWCAASVAPAASPLLMSAGRFRIPSFMAKEAVNKGPFVARAWNMDEPHQAFRTEVGKLAEQWLGNGLPSRQVLERSAEKLQALRKKMGVQGLWAVAPCMITATLDDGLGQGLAIIEAFAAAIGIRLVSLGLMRTPEEVVDTCCRHRPDFLGMTVLQFDTEDELKAIAAQLPPNTQIVAGGPVFSGDPEFAARTGCHYAARDVADFLRYMVDNAATAAAART